MFSCASDEGVGGLSVPLRARHILLLCYCSAMSDTKRSLRGCTRLCSPYFRFRQVRCAAVLAADSLPDAELTLNQTSSMQLLSVHRSARRYTLALGGARRF